MNEAISGLLQRWRENVDTAECIVHTQSADATDAIYDTLTPPLPPSVAAALADRGIDQLFRHQAAAIRSIRDRNHTVIVAGTASGKSLCYQATIAEEVARNPAAAAIAMYPTKALTQDQLRGFAATGVPKLVASVYDGDTDRDARAWSRKNANVILTNPDMLHVGILPNHARWKHLFSQLSFVVVDELHMLRGIFGSHVALMLRRLRRIANSYGSDPTFVFTSATIGNPGELAASLIGAPVTVIDQDTAPTGHKTYVLWNPELEDPLTGARASSLGEATRVFTDMVGSDLHSIVFTRSRKASELIYRWSRDRLDSERRDRIASYRGGYLPEERRKIEKALFSGELLGVAATNALELGIDVGGLDGAVITTFPGTIASFRQQAGRAGRDLQDSLAVLVAGQDALDQYYMTHPSHLFSREPEAAVINPENPEILRSHIGCAAAEIPLVPEDRAFLGESLEEIVPDLAGSGALRLRDGKLYWARRRPPAPDVNIRTSGGPQYMIGTTDGTLLGSIDEERAFTQCHTGAIYLHQGDTYVVENLDTHDHEVTVRRGEVGYYTQTKIEKDLDVTTVAASSSVGRLGRHHGMVQVETQILGYQRKEIQGGRVLDTVPLDLPTRRFTSTAFWFTFPQELFDECEMGWTDMPGVLHAIEHTAIAMLPLYAICDRWDVGGLSTALHPFSGGPLFFIYDGYPGGAGIAPIGYDVAARHLAATLSALDDCPCADGCPSCVQSPKCGNFNDPLDKHGAARMLRTALES